MKTLKLLLEAADSAIEANGFDEISKRLNEIKELFKIRLDEGFTDNHNGELEKKFDDLETKLINARRQLGSVNGDANLSAEDKAEMKSQIMTRINVFRKTLFDVMHDLGMADKEMKYHLDRIALDRKYSKPVERFTRVNKNERVQNSALDINKQRNSANPEDMRDYFPAKSDANKYKKTATVDKDAIKQKFSQRFNGHINYDKPEGYVSPKLDTRKWYQKLFGR